MVIRGIMRFYWKKGVNHTNAAKDIYEFKDSLIINKKWFRGGTEDSPKDIQVKKTKIILEDKETLIVKMLKYRHWMILRKVSENNLWSWAFPKQVCLMDRICWVCQIDLVEWLKDKQKIRRLFVSLITE